MTQNSQQLKLLNRIIAPCTECTSVNYIPENAKLIKEKMSCNTDEAFQTLVVNFVFI